MNKSTATVEKVSQGAAADAPPAEVSGDERALRAIPQLSVSVVISDPDPVATEKFSVPLIVTPGNAKQFADAIARHFTAATSRAIDAYTRKRL